MVVDSTDEEGLKRCEKWIKNLMDHGDENLFIALVSNKIDIVSEQQISFEEAVQFTDKYP